MTSNELESVPAAGVQKRRACDECRSRKLACTKEPNGCSRCLREGITCHYSPQKRMGRPRKRRLVEEAVPTDEDVSGEDVVTVPARGRYVGDAGADAIPRPVEEDISLASFPMDSSLNFLNDVSTPNLDFLDLLPSSYPYHDTSQFDPQIIAPSDSVVDGAGYPFAFNGGVDLLGGINFDEPDTSTADMSKVLSDSLHRHWASSQNAPLEPPESCSSAVSQSAGSPESQSGPSTTTTSSSEEAMSNTPKAIPSISCGCLSSLYLALDSLSRLPSDIPSAMRVARNATKIAHDVIQCPFCSDILTDDPLQPPPIQAFQNLMCLAALVPSACNAYAGILEMLDKETAAAKEEHRQIWFSFKDLGGLWGTMADTDNCQQSQALSNRYLEPDTWRNTMRAILRLDVYGFQDPPEDMTMRSRCRQNGLKDVVKLLEERSSQRHDKLDEMAAQGKLPQHSRYMLMPGPYRPVPPDQRNCIRVLEAARIALENLVIA